MNTNYLDFWDDIYNQGLGQPTDCYNDDERQIMIYMFTAASANEPQ